MSKKLKVKFELDVREAIDLERWLAAEQARPGFANELTPAINRALSGEEVGHERERAELADENVFLAEKNMNLVEVNCRLTEENEDLTRRVNDLQKDVSDLGAFLRDKENHVVYLTKLHDKMKQHVIANAPPQVQGPSSDIVISFHEQYLACAGLMLLAIKAVRDRRRELSLKEAKELVEKYSNPIPEFF